MSSVTVRAPAKVNLQLSVGALRPDGYHDLVNVFQAVSLHDEVTATASADFTVEVVAASAGIDVSAVPRDGDNLAVRAARLLADRVGIDSGVHLSIRKAIPVAGGDGGRQRRRRGRARGLRRPVGDAPAADGTHVFVGQHWARTCPSPSWVRTAVGFGRGDQLSPVLGRGAFNWVFALAEGGLSAAAAYAECDRLRAVDPACGDRPRAVDRADRDRLRASAARAVATRPRSDVDRSCWPRCAPATPRRWVGP